MCVQRVSEVLRARARSTNFEKKRAAKERGAKNELLFRIPQKRKTSDRRSKYNLSVSQSRSIKSNKKAV